MQDLLPARAQGTARIEHFSLDAEAAAFWAAEARDWTIQPGRFARLYVRDQLVMSDTLMERASNWEFVLRAHGRVLVAGLGLGLILAPALAKTDVTHITVVEREQDVIDLVAPAFSAALDAGRLAIAHGDIFGWRPPAGARYETIYFDIWPTISTEHLGEIARLHRRYGRWLNHADPAAWMSSWQLARLRQDRRLGTQPW